MLGVILFAYSKNKTEQQIILSEYLNDELYLKFITDFPSVKPIVCEKADVTNDSVEDLIIIYKDAEKIFMRVLINGESIVYTDEVPAPAENQSIELRNIDDKDELEFIIRGSKRGNVGYAIYRIIDNQDIDLLGDGMDECC